MKKIFKNISGWYRRNILSKVRWFFNGLKRWFSYFKVCFRVVDFDYSSILEIEKHQLERVRNSIAKYQSHLNWERNVREIDIAIKLLDIVLHEGADTIYVGKPMEFDEKGTLVFDPNRKWIYPYNVNINNASRFVSPLVISKFNTPSIGDLMREHLRIEKAWYLYHRIRKQYLRNWWD